MDILTNVSAAATSTAEMAWLFAGNFVALIVLTVLLLVFAMRGGRSGLISLIISFYVGYAIFLIFPYTEFVVSAGGTALVKAVLSAGLFLIMTVIPFLVIRRITGGGFGSLSFLQNFLLSVLTGAFLLSLGYHAFDLHNIYSFSEPLNQLFAPEGFFFYWFIAPLLGLFLFAR